MSWDCPYLKNEICELNNIECKPALGNCILKDKAVPVSRIKKNNPEQNNKNKNSDKKSDRV